MATLHMANRRLLPLLASALLLSGCFGMAATEVPLPSIATVSSPARSDTLVVMLPGYGDRADVFIREGFHETGERLGFDTVAVDAHLGYYRERSLLERLHEDIVLPARNAGYEQIWFLGISMGGLGTLLYASEYPEQVDGVILLAPFLGDRSAIREVVESGPLETWNGDASRMEDYEVRIWSWIRDATRQPEPTPLVLGFGREDSRADGYERLLDVIRPAGVYTLDGGHKWTTWGPLWERIAADLEL